MRKLLWLLIGCLALGTFPGSMGQKRGTTLKKVGEFDLPGPTGKRFDYLTIDPEDHYLISAHLAAGQTYVIDLRSNKVVATHGKETGRQRLRRAVSQALCFGRARQSRSDCGRQQR